jgi:cobalt/nickel transport system ATP-binding protein
MSPAALSLRNVTVYRTSETGASEVVVTDLCLELAPGERCMLAGPNGAGKTSLLLALVGALPFTGEVKVGEQVLEHASLHAIRRRVGFVFANPDEQLFCETVWDEVAFGPRQRGLSSSQVDLRVRQALSEVGLGQHAGKNPHRLSLGEQRRVAVATALAIRPVVMLFDEPTASLDPVARSTIVSVLAKTEATVVMASHDLEAARQLEATVALLNGGRLIASGPAERILSDEQLLRRAGLLADKPTS